jgi:adenosylhomocysteine nucleosidase
MLAPMDIELQPIVRLAGLERDGSVWRGAVGAVEVVAILTNIGMANGTLAATRILEHRVDHVFVVGIAGAVDPALSIGDMIFPEVVVDRASGRASKPAPVGSASLRGILSCGDDLIVEATTLGALAGDGVIALDMETAAVAAVCDGAQVPWTAFRAISDHAGGGLISPEIFAFTRPDGSADHDAVLRYLDEHPDQGKVLAQLAHDSELATNNAAKAAIAACAEF